MVKMALRFFSLTRTSKKCLLLLLFLVGFVNWYLGIRSVDLSDHEEPGRNNYRAVSRDQPVTEHGKPHNYTKLVTLNKRVDSESCPSWCYGRPSRHDQHTERNDSTKTKPYFLTAVLSFRIYDWKDKAKLSTRELNQWIRYVSYAGADHVYLYDAYVYQNESQKEGVQDFIASGFVTYTDWHHRAAPFSLGWTQAGAYADCIQRWGDLTSWQLGVDMDEYPFVPADREPGFLARYLRAFDSSSPTAASISELSMPNYLYLGKPLDVKKHPLLIDRIWRRSKKPANHLVKPVYRPAAIRHPDIHHNSLKYGTSKTLPDNGLRMNHYWGSRLQNWGDDTKEVLDMTVDDRSMEPVIASLYKCDSCRPPYQ
ncbi:uncharacterized protein LOC119744399 [Patiria miniata]|uniref:Glycosyltransferase family 92 protein n=1 Tax=Patiria miniata TaxID=46514 RepID=A0A914BIY1_PATMI|nr:uncharacterized protein LOC119744399 [Patiria miniata]